MHRARPWQRRAVLDNRSVGLERRSSTALLSRSIQEHAFRFASEPKCCASFEGRSVQVAYHVRSLGATATVCGPLSGQ